jgi:hypothetical protein
MEQLMMKDGMGHDFGLERGLYLVVMTERVVAEDLRGAILEYDPGAVVVIEESLAAADAALLGSDLPLQGAFVTASPAELAESRIGAAMRAMARSAVLLGDAAEQDGPGEGYLVLVRPFSTSDVHALLAQRTDA